MVSAGTENIPLNELRRVNGKTGMCSNNWKCLTAVFLFLVLFISLEIGILFYHNLKDEISTQKELYDSVKGEMDNQKALYHSVNNSVTENIEALKALKNEMINQKVLYGSLNSSIIEVKNEILYKIVDYQGNRLQILVMGGYTEYTQSSDILLLDYYQKTWKQLSIKLPYKVSGHGTVILDDQLYIIGGLGSSNTVYRLNKKMDWEKLEDMHEERDWITNSCLVHNGNIWVIGGWNGNYSNTMEKYDPATNRWEMKPAMKRPRAFTAAAVINNKIYVCGGWNGSSPLDSVEVFDIESEAWTDFNTLPATNSRMSMIVDGTSIVLIGGDSNTVWKMDVEEKNKGWINLAPLKESRYDSSAVRIETGRILVFGGETYNSGTLSSSSSVETFDGHKWESFTPLPEPRRLHTSVVLTGAMVDYFRSYVQK